MMEASHKSCLVYGSAFLNYDFGPNHPLQPIRLRLTYELIRDLGILDSPNSYVVPPRLANDDEIALVHSPEYINKVIDLSFPGARWGLRNGAFGLGTLDNPIFEGMHDASSCTVGASLVAMQEVMEGRADHSFNMSGGLHHSHPNYASGFCIYNDAAITIEALRKKYNVRVLYLDIDAHHGDGVQDVFYNSKDVMTISIHETGEQLFPGTGDYREIGEGEGIGYSINVPLQPLTYDEIYLDVFRSIVPPAARLFKPDIIVTQMGCDAHWNDPLAHLLLTLQGYKIIYNEIHNLVHEICGGKWIAVGGGGYNVYSTVPKAWTLLYAEMCKVEVPELAPQSWVAISQNYDTEPVSSALIDHHVPAISEERKKAAIKGAKEVVDYITNNVFPLIR